MARTRGAVARHPGPPGARRPGDSRHLPAPADHHRGAEPVPRGRRAPPPRPDRQGAARGGRREQGRRPAQGRVRWRRSRALAAAGDHADLGLGQPGRQGRPHRHVDARHAQRPGRPASAATSRPGCVTAGGPSCSATASPDSSPARPDSRSTATAGCGSSTPHRCRCPRTPPNCPADSRVQVPCTAGVGNDDAAWRDQPVECHQCQFSSFGSPA